MNRRRFIGLAAGFAAFPAFADRPARWRGVALGADASITLSAPDTVARAALKEAVATLEAVENTFSLYRAESFVSRLNRTGHAEDAPDLYWPLHEMVTDLHQRTGGLFDPSVQGAWQAIARGENPWRASLYRWTQVRPFFGGAQLAPRSDHQVTFNGIAQGYATDLVVGVLRAHGLTDAFVDIGEQAAIGAARLLGVSDPDHGIVGQLTLRGGAVATSSAAATPLGATGHILRPGSPDTLPVWSTVSVEAESATLADGLSTALIHADLPKARQLRRMPGLRRILLVDTAGNVRTL